MLFCLFKMYKRLNYKLTLLTLSLIFIMLWAVNKLNTDPDITNTCWGGHHNCEPVSMNSPYLIPDPYPTAVPSNRPIMFIDSHQNTVISPRVWCSIESAAKAHSGNEVRLYVNSRQILRTFVMQQIMITYANVKILYYNDTELFENSPLDDWFTKRLWERSYWPKSHFNDALRWLLLWKYGGVYLDTDVLVKDNLLTDSDNFAGYESDKYVGAGVIGLQPKHYIAQQALDTMANHFDGKVWGAYGPELLTDALRKQCGLIPPLLNTPDCPDVSVYGKYMYYPIPWWKWKDYKTEYNPDLKSVAESQNTKAFHVWNHFLNAYPINKQPETLFSVLANKLCPVVMRSSDDVF